MYSTCGRSAATAATADHAVAALWNPHTTQRIKVVQWAIVCQTAPSAAGKSFRFRRISARGTPGSTVTPGLAADHRYSIAPPSGVLLDLSIYSVQPTFITGELGLKWVFPAVAAGAIVYPFPGGIVIPPGTGLCFQQIDATAANVFDHTPTWAEDW